MVMRANDNDGALADIFPVSPPAQLYDIGVNHFWRGTEGGHPGDLVFYRGHSAPGMYAFLSGRQGDEQQLDRFRRGERRRTIVLPPPVVDASYWAVRLQRGTQAIYQARARFEV
jgi:pyruvate dehydrogenase E1 component